MVNRIPFQLNTDRLQSALVSAGIFSFLTFPPGPLYGVPVPPTATPLVAEAETQWFATVQ